ncbi:MAG: GNAT family N-acetyltransferase [Propionibacteriaceae bacterium]|nr:GNAT family N-acetyltransferase [Propionibacteriaceae bacterium]
MTQIMIKAGITPGSTDLVDLYSSVGWSAYTQDPSRLQEAVRRSLLTATAWEDDRLVGLARVVGDAVSIIYMQDVLVHPSHQRKGIGRALVREVFSPFADVRQHVLLTDSEPGQTAFYTSLGFTDIRDMPGGLRSFVRIFTGDTD